WPAREPEAKVQELQPEVEERAAARLRASQPPAEQLAAGLKRVPPAADRLQGAQVTACQESAHCLDVRAEAVVHSHHDALAILLARLEHALDTCHGEREGPLDSTPRASTVTRQCFAPISAPIVPFPPAVIWSSASSTNVPSIALPLPLRR